MSEDRDDEDGEKPLDPTEKRIREALESGNQPFAREAPLVAMLVGLTCTLGLMLVPVTIRTADRLALLMGQVGELRIEGRAETVTLVRQILFDVGGVMLPVLAVFVVAGVLASVSQNRPRMIASRITPKWSHVSPASGVKRIFGPMGLMEFARALVKLALVITVLAGVLYGARQAIAVTMLTDPVDAADAMRVIALNLVTAMLIATSIVLAVDVLWSRHHWTSQLRMNHQEMKDEMKDADGDPHVKAKRLAIQRQRMKRMMADVPKASVVIVNPTHYAVALRYDAKGAGVPQVVAKGMDHVALRIREVAAEHKVPLVEDVQLARALHACVEVGQFIPRDLFEAVASVIHIIMTRRPGATGLIRRERFSGL